MPGVHAVVTHEDVPGEKSYGLSSATSPSSRSTACATSASRSCSSPPIIPSRRAAPPRRSRVEYEPLEPVTDLERASSGPSFTPDGRHPGTATVTTTAPNVVRTSSSATATRTPGRRRRRAASTRPGSRTRRSSAPSPDSPCPTARAGSTSTSPPMAPCRPRADRPVPRSSAGARRASTSPGVGGAFGGREDVSMQIHAALLALHTNRPVKIVYTREESFTGHVHRHPSRIWAAAPRDPRRQVRLRRMRILLDGGAYASSSTRGLLERRLLRLRAVRRPERAPRRDGRLHEQSAVRRDARLRRRADVLRGRGADGQARRGAGDRSRRAAPAERARTGRHAPDRPADRGIAADRRGDPPRRRARAAGRRRSCRATRSGFRAAPATRRAARESTAASASPSASRTSASPRDSTTTAPRVSGSSTTAPPRSTALPPRSVKACRT